MTEPIPANNRGWIVVLAGIAIKLVLGSLYAWGVLAKALVVEWHWSRTDAALPFTVSTAAFAVMMIFAGRMQDRLGPRVVAVLGGIMFGIGLVGSSAAHSPGVMLLTYGLLGGMGIGLCYSATTPPAIKWFPAHKKGLVTGMVVSGVGLAAVYVSPLTQFLLQKTSIPQTFLILGIGATVAISLVSMFLANPPAGFQPAAAPTGVPRPKMGKAAQMDWHEMVRTAEFYRLWSTFALAASAGLMIIAHVAIIAREQVHWELGYVPVALLAIFNTLGRIVSGYVSDRIGRRETMLLAFVLQALNMLAFAFYTTPGLLVFGSAFTGLCYGTIFTLMPAATADSYGVKNLGVNYGLVFTAFGVAGVLGPILGGRIRDLSGSYTASYVISAVMLLIGAGLAFRTRKSQAAEAIPSRAR